jgi:hypothetical membrane protein
MPLVRVVRGLALAAPLAVLLFLAAWIVAAALEPGFSFIRGTASDLASERAEHPWIVRAASVVLGLGLAALAPGLLRTLPSRHRVARALAGALFAAAGTAIAVNAMLPVSCSLATDGSCRQALDAGALPAQHVAHIWVGLAAQVLILLTPVALARALWPDPLALPLTGVALTGVAIAALSWAVYANAHNEGSVAGLVQLVNVLTLCVWVTLVAGGIRHATRPRGVAVVTPSDLPPRTFLAPGAWRGHGVATGLPAFLWRRFAIGFEAERTVTWISDDLYVADDRIEFHSGRVEERRLFCQLTAPDRIHVSADHLLDGAHVVLSERGPAVLPFDLLVPVGPLRIPLRTRDRFRLDADGTLIDDLQLSFAGVPVGQATIWVRRRDDPPRPTRPPQPLTEATAARSDG